LTEGKINDAVIENMLAWHIPGRYEQTVRYYGWYSNKSRGMRKKAGTDDTIPAVMPNELSSKESRQNWARLIRKIYEVDPLVCPKCQGQMRIISFIEELAVIEPSPLDRIQKQESTGHSEGCPGRSHPTVSGLSLQR